ncbi:hypothetical protein QYZ87_02070 [Porphyromonadaceae bacterium W3.11]|nr:hypothetical protein [Porphyromonadaceae bacterium W3.11]
MKRNLINVLIVALATMLALSSCKNMDKPVDPTDETKEKNHDLPDKIELTLYRGHFHGFDLHGSGMMEGQKYFKDVQTIIFKNVPGKGFQISPEGDQQFAILGGISSNKKASDIVDPATANWTNETFSPSKVTAAQHQYGLIIKLYNKGEEITSQFVTNGQDKIHQFFFLIKNQKASKYGDQSKEYPNDYRLMNYFYYDTDPWNETIHGGAKLIGPSNPIGFKGILEFYEPYTQFDLNVKLLHARSSKFDTPNKKASPFYMMHKQQIARDDTDVNITIPIYVFGDSNEYLNANKFEEMTESEKRLVNSLAEACNISPEEAFHDLWLQINGEPPVHDIDTGYHL